MTAREQRLRELLIARQHLDERIAEFDAITRIAVLPPSLPVRDPMVRIAAYARDLVQSGRTHAETAHTLGIPMEQVTPLLEVARRAA